MLIFWDIDAHAERLRQREDVKDTLILARRSTIAPYHLNYDFSD
jgi:hypothetical protein